MELDHVIVDGRDRLARIDLAVYGLDSILKSAYRFTGPTFIHLQTVAGDIVEIRMRPKLSSDDPDLVIREFFNDLLDQKLREIVANETVGIRDLIMAHALSNTSLIRPDLENTEPPGRAQA